MDTKCRLGDLHVAFVMDKDVATGHAQWWRSHMKEKVDTQTRKDPGASFVMHGGEPVLTAWVAERYNRNLDRN